MSKIINIVGAGLAGSIMAAVLREAGYDTRIFDDNDTHSASKASSNLYVGSWLKKFLSAGAANGVAVLERLYGKHIEQPFSGGIASAGKVKHIPQRHILLPPDVPHRVSEVSSAGVNVMGTQFGGATVLCTGHKAALCPLLPQPTIKVGHALFFEGQLSPGNSRLALVSPYVHEKLFQFSCSVVYYADSVAIRPEVYAKRAAELSQRTLDRARRHVGRMKLIELKVGYRPFVPGHDFGYAEQLAAGIYALNSGGKNGMVAYAHGATKILELIRKNG